MTNAIVTEYQWKDVEAWKDYGLPLSTPSNEAAKMVDAFILQLIGWYNDESLGGIPGTIKRIKEADPEYVLGPLIESRFKLSNHSPETNSELQASLSQMEALVKKRTINDWEMEQVEALRHYAEGYSAKSLDIWIKLTIKNPFDLFSLVMAHTLSSVLGKFSEKQEMMDRVVPLWKPHMSMYGYVQGINAFALNETGHYDEAEKCAAKALEFNPCDAYATHAKAHIMDNTNRADQGITFMENTENNWKTGTIIMEHSYWHLALFYLDKGDYESAFGVLDNHILPNCSSRSERSLRDASSLLYRFRLEGLPTGKRFQEINPYWLPTENTFVFDDTHRMVTYLGANDSDSAAGFLESCNAYLRKGEGTNWEVTKDVGLPLCQALVAFEKEQYDEALDLIYPIRHDIIKIGGSYSQRDLFNLVLIHAAVRSSKENHQELACQLVEERKAFLGETGVTLRLDELVKNFRKL